MLSDFYRPQRSWGKVIFSEACVKNSVHRGEASGQTPPEQIPLGSSACWEIRATSGRYASYWNAYLSDLTLYDFIFGGSERHLTGPFTRLLASQLPGYDWYHSSGMEKCP